MLQIERNTDRCTKKNWLIIDIEIDNGEDDNDDDDDDDEHRYMNTHIHKITDGGQIHSFIDD